MAWSCNKPANSLASELVRVIFDTDIDSDVDDVGALAMLYNLQKQNKINLLGVIVTSDDPYAPTCVSALNQYYGFGHLPIGFLEDQSELRNHSRYTRQLSEEYPHELQSWQETATATATYRKLLAESPDNSVIIITVGHLSSLQKLLQSDPDEFSPDDGKALVNAKVQKWICMGGQFPQGKEANFYRPDPQSTTWCIRNWEKEVVFCGWEAGNKIITGGPRLRGKLAPEHPVYRAYELYNGFAGRPSWDQIAVLQLTGEAGSFFSYVTGHCNVAPDGSNTWTDDRSGKHRYVVFNPSIAEDYISYYTDNLMAGTIPFTQKNPWNKKDPVRLIFDTDMLTDCDDAAAMAILHKLADNGEVNILGTMVSSRYPMSGPVVDAINTYYGRPDTPVGTPKNGTGVYRSNSVFLDSVASEFPHRLQSNDDAPDAVELYRQILSSQPDSSVVILTVGYMSNLETLLKSGPDHFSELPGYELVKKKVKCWICMGGNFPVDPALDNVNFTRDAPAAVYAIQNWPGDIVFAGREIGHRIFIGEKLRSLPNTNPVRRVYELHRGRVNPQNWDHHTADPCAVLLAVRGLSDYWGIEKDGYIDLKDDCSFAWTPKTGARQAYIIQKMDRETLGNIMEELLISPPEPSF
jgi:hypothetical protein